VKPVCEAEAAELFVSCWLMMDSQLLFAALVTVGVHWLI